MWTLLRSHLCIAIFLFCFWNIYFGSHKHVVTPLNALKVINYFINTGWYRQVDVWHRNRNRSMNCFVFDFSYPLTTRTVNFGLFFKTVSSLTLVPSICGTLLPSPLIDSRVIGPTSLVSSLDPNLLGVPLKLKNGRRILINQRMNLRHLRSYIDPLLHLFGCTAQKLLLLCIVHS